MVSIHCCASWKWFQKTKNKTKQNKKNAWIGGNSHALLQPDCSLVGDFQDNMNVEHEPWSKLRDGSISCVPCKDFRGTQSSLLLSHGASTCSLPMTCLRSELTSHLITFCSPVTLVYNCVCIFMPIHILLQPDCSLVGIHSRMHSCLFELYAEVSQMKMCIP